MIKSIVEAYEIYCNYFLLLTPPPIKKYPNSISKFTEFAMILSKFIGIEDIVPPLNMIMVRHMAMPLLSISRIIGPRSSHPPLIPTVRVASSPPTTPTSQRP